MTFRPSLSITISVVAVTAALTAALLSFGVPTARALDGSVAVDCDASAGGIQSNCAYAIGATFDVQIHVMGAPTAGYYSHQMKLGWGDAQLDYLPTSNPTDENLWNDCTLPLRLDNRSGNPPDSSVLFGCSPLPPLRTGEVGTGAILQFQFRCLQAGNGSLKLVPRAGDPQNGSHFLDAVLNPIDPAIVNATVDCVTAPTPTPTPLPTATATPIDPNLDSDGDGCTDVQELAGDPMLGGQRDPFSFWDFFDTPDAGGSRDQAITVADIGGVVSRFGASPESPLTEQEALAEAFTTPPPAPAYHAAFDRGGPVSGMSLWNQLSPNGGINIADIGAVVAQFGHSCTGAPSA